MNTYIFNYSISNGINANEINDFDNINHENNNENDLDVKLNEENFEIPIIESNKYGTKITINEEDENEKEKIINKIKITDNKEKGNKIKKKNRKTRRKNSFNIEIRKNEEINHDSKSHKEFHKKNIKTPLKNKKRRNILTRTDEKVSPLYKKLEHEKKKKFELLTNDFFQIYRKKLKDHLIEEINEFDKKEEIPNQKLRKRKRNNSTKKIIRFRYKINLVHFHKKKETSKNGYNPDKPDIFLLRK
jgi:hypothetical protein